VNIKLCISAENGKTPYSATVIINNVHYGSGYASSKKAAKLEAAKASLRILIPDLEERTKEVNPSGTKEKIDLPKPSVPQPAKPKATPASTSAGPSSNPAEAPESSTEATSSTPTPSAPVAASSSGDNDLSVSILFSLFS
jgi:microprocessor complex subunit DGCR8